MHSFGILIQLLGMLYPSRSQEGDSIPAFSGGPSMCSTLQYRSLPPSLQNEHQCILLGRLNEEFENTKANHDTALSDIVT